MATDTKRVASALSLTGAPTARTARVSSRVLIGVLCLALMGIALALVQAINADQRAREQVTRTTEILSVLRTSLRAGLDAETGQRGFLLTEDPRYLVPYDRGSTLWLPTLSRLDLALDDTVTDAQRAAIGRMNELAEAKLEELARSIALARDGRLDDALELVRSDEGKDLMEEYREIVGQLELEEEKILKATLEDARRIEARTLPLLAFLGALVVALVVLGFWLERRTARAEATARDAIEVQRARERSDLLARELNHRVKNLFAVILSIVSLSGRGQTNVSEVVQTIRARIHALSLAHAVSQGQLDTKIVAMHEVLAATLEPYSPHSDDTDRVTLTGDPIELPVKSVTPLGLIIHELATNAAKYGALSTDTGRVEVTWREQDGDEGREVALTWQEVGGPTVASEREDGFGSVMMKQASLQLGGRIERDWNADGVRATLTVPL